MGFGLPGADVSMKYSVRIADNSAVRLAASTFFADLGQQSTPPAKDNPASKLKIQLSPDSYVGAVVGTMFLAGVILLLAKWPRRRVRRNIYRFPRAPRRARRAS
jgi:hypothetical protein